MSEPIWLLSTRRRPAETQAAIDACQQAGMTSRGVVYVDEDDGSYDRLRLPRNWRIHKEQEWLSLQGSMTWCFEEYPDASQYGWLADDTRPRTSQWDRWLETAAGDWNLAYARDLWFSENPGELEQLERGHNLSSGLCWGGELVRAVGWWALPGVRQAGIDMAWLDIARPLGLTRYCHDVVVEHLNWRTGKRPYDETDNWERDGVGYINRDFAAKTRWATSPTYRKLMHRLTALVPTANQDTVQAAIRQSLLDQLWTSGMMPGARLANILDGFKDDVLLLENAFYPETDAV